MSDDGDLIAWEVLLFPHIPCYFQWEMRSLSRIIKGRITIVRISHISVLFKFSAYLNNNFVMERNWKDTERINQVTIKDMLFV